MIGRSLFLTATLLCGTTAPATISVDLVEVDNSANPILNGYRTFDLIINTDSQWTTSAMYLELSEGSVYQDAFGPGFNAPNPDFLALLEQSGTPNGLRFDTYYAPVDYGQGNPATDVGGSPNVFVPDTEGISRSWGSPDHVFTQAGQFSSGTQLAMRITLSDDAEGSWSFGATEVGSPQAKFLNNPITAGAMSYVPLQGDLNRDGFVGIEDLSSVLSNWNLIPTDPCTVNPSCMSAPSPDDIVGLEDLNGVLGNWNAGTPRRPILATPNNFGDLNNDGFVGISDLKVPNSRWGQQVAPGDMDDPSGDGFVGLDDLAVVIETWNQGTPPAAVTPEPMTLALTGLGLVALAGRPRGRG